MRKMGPIWNLSSMRCESKNGDLKKISNLSLNRSNICKSLATKCQLQFSHKLRSTVHLPCDEYEKGPASNASVYNLPHVHHYKLKLPLHLTDQVRILSQISFQHYTITKNVVLMRPAQEENQFFLIDSILEDATGKLHLVVKSITDYAMYDDHYQAYEVEDSYEVDQNCWHCLGLNDLQLSTISYMTTNGKGCAYFPKRWI